MAKLFRMNIMNHIVQTLVTIARQVYALLVQPLKLYQSPDTRKTEVWLHIMYSMTRIESMWDLEIDPTKTDSDLISLLYNSFPDSMTQRLRLNPFSSYSSSILSWKNIVINSIIEL